MPFFCFSEETKWVIAAQKFTYTKGQEDNSITSATAESVPANILERINKLLVRNVYPDEKLERTRYKLRNERQSLYLQLSSEYKKRDALLLNNYSSVKLKKNIRDEEKKIQEIRDKISENLETLRNEEDKLEQNMQKASLSVNTNGEESQLKGLTRLFRKIFIKEDALITNENIAFYNDDVTALYTPSEKAMKDGYTGFLFDKNISSANINTLITGKITSYGEYLSVEVDMYVYPGAKKVASVMEIGSTDDMELITTSIANQLVPYITNSMPVDLMFTVNPVEASNYSIYIDDVLQTTDGKNIDIESGVHTIQFVCEGYKTAETSYYFEGNKKYQIDVDLIELKEGTVTFELKKVMEGDILINGKLADKIDERHTSIKINGNQILGEFIGEEGKTAFFYVPQENYYDGSYVRINPKTFDRDKYIDVSRKVMYGSYSAFMVSLIPFFYTYGNLVNEAELYKNHHVKYQEAIKWQNAYNVCSVITISCGAVWGASLIHYLFAANTVLPSKAKAPKKKKNKTEVVSEVDITVEEDVLESAEIEDDEITDIEVDDNPEIISEEE